MINNEEGRPSGLERHAQTLIQMLIFVLVVWIGNTVFELSKTAVKVESQSVAANASSARVELKLSTMETQLQVVDRNVYIVTSRQEDFERRLKGLEALRERKQ